jgi:hypothetical protein
MKSNESMIISMPPCIQFDVGLPFYTVYGFSVKYLRVVHAPGGTTLATFVLPNCGAKTSRNSRLGGSPQQTQ